MYSLSIRVQITMNHISIFTFLCFYDNINVKEIFFFSECELKKALRDTLTRAAWLGPVMFYCFVLSMRMQVILDSTLLSPARVQPLYGRGKKGEFRDWTILGSEFSGICFLSWGIGEQARVKKADSRLRWLKTVSSTFQDVDFDGSLLPLFIS